MRYFSLISSGEIHATEGKSIIPKESFSQLLEAAEIIQKAKEDAEKLLEKTRQECKKMRVEAKREGHLEGLSLMNEKIVEIDSSFKEFCKAASEDVPRIAIAAAKKIIGNELEFNPETIYAILRTALKPILEHKHFTIYVSRDESREKIRDALIGELKSVLVDYDDSLQKGDCIIHFDHNSLEARIDEQLERLEMALRKGV